MQANLSKLAFCLIRLPAFQITALIRTASVSLHEIGSKTVKLGEQKKSHL